jgi:hypothetical protein
VTSDSEQAVAAEDLAELRRRLDVGLALMEGRMALLTQRDEQSAKEHDDLHTRVASLEHNRWPLPALGVLTALGTLGVMFWQLVGN